MILACLVLASLQTGVAPAMLPPAYAELLHLYETGEQTTALARLPLLPASTVRAAREQIEKDVAARRSLERAEAAAMMHTDLVLAQSGEPVRRLTEDHLAIANRLVDALQAADRRPFVRDWYLLMLAFFQSADEYGPARTYAEDARARFRDDPEILLASGTLHEQQARLGTGRLPSRGAPGGFLWIDAREELRRASIYYTRALALDLGPSAAEARLRRGRVAHVLGNPGAAERDLEEAAASATDPAIQYLALVFLGSVKEDLARRGDAALLYAKAARLRPDGQVVFIALASLYFSDGQPDEAAKMTERLFAPADPLDPWWMYQRGQGWVFEARLARLRDQVQRR